MSRMEKIDIDMLREYLYGEGCLDKRCEPIASVSIHGESLIVAYESHKHGYYYTDRVVLPVNELPAGIILEDNKDGE